MKRITLSVFSLVILVGCSSAQSGQPEDIMQYVKIADECQYLSGEWDSNLPAERKAAIEKAVSETCPKANTLQKTLQVKYQNQQTLIDIINRYDF